MTIKALGPYEFPAKDRQEVFGEDQLVHVLWEGNMLFCCPGLFRVPRAMSWSDFQAQMVEPWAAADPDYDKDKVVEWLLDDEPIQPGDNESIAGIGVPHKGLLKFRVG
jgi:phenol hydroxylase P4 protein